MRGGGRGRLGTARRPRALLCDDARRPLIVRRVATPLKGELTPEAGAAAMAPPAPPPLGAPAPPGPPQPAQHLGVGPKGPAAGPAPCASPSAAAADGPAGGNCSWPVARGVPPLRGYRSTAQFGQLREVYNSR